MKGIRWNGLQDIFPPDLKTTLAGYWEKELGRLVHPVPDMDAVLEQLKRDLGWLDSVPHHRNFLDCLKTGQQPFASGEIGHRTATICHLNNIAMTLGRKLTWSPEKERFDAEDDANQLLKPRMRSWLVPSELSGFGS